VAPAQVMIYGVTLIAILRFRSGGIVPERPGRDVVPLMPAVQRQAR
jgi:hypothetical protein